MIKKKIPITRLSLLLFRVLLALIVFAALLLGNDVALHLFVLTAFVAFLDGFIAKKSKVVSQIRSIIDPFADKLLVNLAAVALFLKGILPLWVMLVFVVKDALVVIGGFFVLIKNSKTMFRTNVIDKIAVFMQLFTLFFAIMGRVDYVLVWISVVLLVASFIATLFRSGVRVVPYKTDLEEIRFRKLIKLPDLFTLFNILMGLFAILLSVRNLHFFAVLFLLLAVLFDYLDGKVARFIKREGDFGKQLDSLADTVSFGVAPAVFGFTLVQTNFAIIVFALFLFAGVLRLARYNVMEFSDGFAGMPITVNGVLIPLIFLFKVPVVAYPYIYLVLAILMISPLKFKKLF